MALEHITVLDPMHMLPGPDGTLLQADLGARTITVEPPGSGEATRRVPPNSGGSVCMPGHPIKLYAAPRDMAFTCALALGESTRQVLHESIGYSSEQREGPSAEGAIA